MDLTSSSGERSSHRRGRRRQSLVLLSEWTEDSAPRPRLLHHASDVDGPNVRHRPQAEHGAAYANLRALIRMVSTGADRAEVLRLYFYQAGPESLPPDSEAPLASILMKRSHAHTTRCVYHARLTRARLLRAALASELTADGVVEDSDALAHLAFDVMDELRRASEEQASMSLHRCYVGSYSLSRLVTQGQRGADKRRV